MVWWCMGKTIESVWCGGAWETNGECMVWWCMGKNGECMVWWCMGN